VAQSWLLGPEGKWMRADLPAQNNPFSCHRFFMENPSLSGRGSAGAKDVPELTHSAE
jgi:polyphosphate kinase